MEEERKKVKEKVKENLLIGLKNVQIDYFK